MSVAVVAIVGLPESAGADSVAGEHPAQNLLSQSLTSTEDDSSRFITWRIPQT